MSPVRDLFRIQEVILSCTDGTKYTSDLMNTAPGFRYEFTIQQPGRTRVLIALQTHGGDVGVIIYNVYDGILK